MESGMNRRKLFASVAAVVLVTVAGLLVWSAIQERAKAAKRESEILKEIKPEQLKEVLKSEATADAPTVREIASDPGKRKDFLEGLEQHLSLAGQARREGFAETEEFRVNLKYKQDILLADLYRAKLSKGKKRLYVVPQADIDRVWSDPANVRDFEKTMDVLYDLRKRAADAKGGKLPATRLKGDSLKKAKSNFAQTTVLSAMAREDKEFMAQPVIPLRMKIVEAGLLANELLIANYKSFLPTQAEIRQYLAEHPEYDSNRKIEMAKSVLAKVRAGEDFAKLAEKFSEDGGSSYRGGLYEDIGTGALWPEVEAAALKLNPGEIVPGLVESEMGYHMVMLVNNKTPKDGGPVKFSIRHIVIQKKFEEPGDPIPGMRRPFMTAVEIAKQQIEKRKREAFIAEIKARSPVKLPDDFKFDV